MSAEAVKVMVRCRPMSQKEKDRGCSCVVAIDNKLKQVNLFKSDPKQQPKAFTFDYVFGQQSEQQLVYQQTAFSLVDNVLQGYNGTIFAYGQTGCGKTHTMMGSNQRQQTRGIIPRTFSQIMTVTKNDAMTHLIRCSFIQIYNEQIHDLLGKDIKARMQLKQSPDKGIFVKDLSQLQVDGIQKMEKYMNIGFSNRATRATNMNSQSSRSHSIFTIYIDSQEQDQKGNDKYKASKLNLVDLAGSQRASKTGATGDGMKQATKINLSLSALGNVISALVDGKTHHIPYRDSKLTRLLQDSLGGNTKTIMIAALSPADYNYDETLSTLRYASRAKFIQNKPKINEDPKDALLRQYMDQIKKLKMMLQGKAPIDMQAVGIESEGKINTIYQQRIVYRDAQGNISNNQQYQQALKDKQNQLKQEQEEKQLLKVKLFQLQNHLSKGNVPENNNSQLQKLKKLKQKLKAQKKKQQEYQIQRHKRQEQLLNIQKSYKSLNEEVDEMRVRFQQIKKKYMANLSQIRDIQVQHEQQKQELLDTIRFQEKQIKKFSTIISMIMSSQQLDLIVKNSQWSEEKRQWFVPPFTYRQKMVNFPKLSNHNSKELIQSEKQKKQIFFRQNIPTHKKQSNKQQSFRIHQIVKDARQTNLDNMANNSSANLRTNSLASRTQLVALKGDVYQKMKGATINYNNNEVKRNKPDKLDPIKLGEMESRKYIANPYP